MTFPSRLTPEQKSEIVKAYAAGEPVADIAKRYGIHSSYPGQIARMRGCVSRETFPSRKRVPITPEIVEQVPVPSLAAELGIRSYPHWVPSSAPLTAKGEGMDVSLPFVSILGARA